MAAMAGPPRLTRAARAHLPADTVRGLPPEGAGVGIVHLGPGAFHRAHQAVFTQEAMAAEGGDWAICAAAARGRAVVDALRAQDGLYTVTERAADGADRVRVVGAVADAVSARDEPERFAVAVAAPTTHVVTLTVTEAGYRHDPATGRLAEDDPETAADAAGRPPRTAVGQLVRGLQARSRLGGTPLTVLSCDNLPANGRLLRGLVESFCALLPEREGGPLWEWISAHTAFCGTVVDQVVPATTPADVDRVAAALGYRDTAAVVGEAYRSWIIEDAFAGPRPAWERVGARLVADLAPYETVKLRCVNAVHSAAACLGLLLGATTVSEAVGHPALRPFLVALYERELAPSAAAHGGAPPAAEAVLARLGNPHLRHRLAQIAQQGAKKLPQRLLAPAAEHLATGRDPRLACLAVAGWARLLRLPPGERPALEAGSEDIAAGLAAARGPREAVDLLRVHVPALSQGGGRDLGDRVADALAGLEREGAPKGRCARPRRGGGGPGGGGARPAAPRGPAPPPPGRRTAPSHHGR
ncbi:mannitol dehydrogenase family protein [Streptomonospora nanhaiensis]|uniref:mannitol dehydrogenase family protein n=1 Tax=Streptomonospora nanhaiensis TaxID=1323731 RepID=UPI001C39171C|nr:mannitol dehydrogenase family protein [Streptomonospora nanhaiensis]MBV2366096.1 mannitol dehydrogenase family protein [Streptomonospora nanhaiensis]